MRGCGPAVGQEGGGRRICSSRAGSGLRALPGSQPERPGGGGWRLEMGRWRGGWEHSPQSGRAHIRGAHPCPRAGAEGSRAWGLGRVQAGSPCPPGLVCVSQTPEPHREKAGGKGQSAEREAAPAAAQGRPFVWAWLPPGSGPGISSPLGLGSLPAELSRPRPSTSCCLTGSN